MTNISVFRISCISLAIILSSGLAKADTSGYARWNEYPADFKAGFVMGMVASLQIAAVDDQHSFALANGIGDCAKGIGLNSSLIAKAVDSEYETHLDLWSEPPSIITFKVIKSICLKYINDV